MDTGRRSAGINDHSGDKTTSLTGPAGNGQNVPFNLWEVRAQEELIGDGWAT
jgi:hypothetical protein